MDPLPVKLTPKQIVNDEDLIQAIAQSSHSPHHYQIRSDFVSQKSVDLSFVGSETDILEKVKTAIQDYCSDLPHNRLILSIRKVDDMTEVTINPLTCTA
jgi:hypothetical protein